MNLWFAPFVPRDLTARGHVHSSTWPIALEPGAVTGPGLSTVRPDKE